MFVYVLVTVLSAFWIVAHCVDGGVRREGLSSLLTCLDRDSEWISWNSTSGKTALEAPLSKHNTVSRAGLEHKLGEERSALQESGQLNSRHQHALEPAPTLQASVPLTENTEAGAEVLLMCM